MNNHQGASYFCRATDSVAISNGRSVPMNLEQAEYEADIERLKAQCAAMRSALEEVVRLSDRKHNAWDRAKAALATDAGKGYVPAEEVEKLKTCLCLIGERLSKTGRIADFLNQSNAPAEIKSDWKDLVYTSGIRAQMQAACDPRGFVPADKARVIAEALKRHVRHRDWCATRAGKQCCDCTDGMKVARELGLLEEEK